MCEVASSEWDKVRSTDAHALFRAPQPHGAALAAQLRVLSAPPPSVSKVMSALQLLMGDMNPTWDKGRLLISSSASNARAVRRAARCAQLTQPVRTHAAPHWQGDRSALAFKYRVRIVHVARTFDPLCLCAADMQEAMRMLEAIVHDIDFRPNHFRMRSVSLAASAACAWVRAVFCYATAAREIYKDYLRLQTLKTRAASQRAQTWRERKVRARP